MTTRWSAQPHTAPRPRLSEQGRTAPFSWAVLVLCLAAFVGPAADVPRTGGQKREGLNPKIETIIAEFSASVPEHMKKNQVPGVAMALVDEQGIIWIEGFGYADLKGKSPVTPDTPFLINSMSKTITATAVLLAVQDGLVDLDKPITTYLPDFRVYSCFEEHPERKMTLRHLLSCTAGLPVEASLGNLFEPSPTVSFADHVKSLYGTWLVCPVGQALVYGSVSFDVAGYTLQVASGQPFEQYLESRLFAPLGMSNSTASTSKILKNKTRALGHHFAASEIPAVYPALGAGGVYSTARDLSRFVQWHLNQGVWEGKTILNASLLRAMYEPRTIMRKPDGYYGYGICMAQCHPENVDLMLYHDGWGFGFHSVMYWYPEYGLGMVTLMNTGPEAVLGDLAFPLTDRLIKERIVPKRLVWPRPTGTNCLPAWTEWPEHKPSPYKPGWKKHCGTYSFRFSGYKLEWWAKLAAVILGRDEWTPRLAVFEKNGYLCLTESSFFDKLGSLWDKQADERLAEVQPGLFHTASGHFLDLRGWVPTWRNYRLQKK